MRFGTGVQAASGTRRKERPLFFITKNLALSADSSLRAKSGWACLHVYKPWNAREAKRDGTVVPWDSLSEEQKWYACVATPMFGPDGQSVLRPDTLEGNRHRGRLLDWAGTYGWRIAMTEWNWNGWSPEPMIGHLWTKGVGAAGFLNAILRAGGLVDLATQSMLVGQRWPLCAVHVPRDSMVAPHHHPTGLVTALYSRYHGDRRLDATLQGVPVYAQPLQIGEIMPQSVVAMTDIVVTADSATVFLHVINRHFTAPCRISVWPEGFALDGVAQVHTLAGPEPFEAGTRDCAGGAKLEHRTVPGERGQIQVDLPARSVSVVALGRRTR